MMKYKWLILGIIMNIIAVFLTVIMMETGKIIELNPLINELLKKGLIFIYLPIIYFILYIYWRYLIKNEYNTQLSIINTIICIIYGIDLFNNITVIIMNFI